MREESEGAGWVGRKVLMQRPQCGRDEVLDSVIGLPAPVSHPSHASHALALPLPTAALRRVEGVPHTSHSSNRSVKSVLAVSLGPSPSRPPAPAWPVLSGMCQLSLAPDNLKSRFF